jgi:hypothetical protein
VPKSNTPTRAIISVHSPTVRQTVLVSQTNSPSQSDKQSPINLIIIVSIQFKFCIDYNKLLTTINYCTCSARASLAFAHIFHRDPHWAVLQLQSNVCILIMSVGWLYNSWYKIPYLVDHLIEVYSFGVSFRGFILYIIHYAVINNYLFSFLSFSTPYLVVEVVGFLTVHVLQCLSSHFPALAGLRCTESDESKMEIII